MSPIILREAHLGRRLKDAESELRHRPAVVEDDSRLVLIRHRPILELAREIGDQLARAANLSRRNDWRIAKTVSAGYRAINCAPYMSRSTLLQPRRGHAWPSQAEPLLAPRE